MKAVQQFDFKSFSEKELAVLIYAQGLHNPQLKEHLLLKLAARKPDEETDLETVHQEALTKTQVRSEVKSRQDILAVRSQSHRSTPAQEEDSASEDEDSPTRRRSQQRRVPRTPCYGCGEMHYRDDCPFSNKTCPACNKIGHKTGFCNFAKPKKAPLEVNLVSAPASSTMNFTRISVRRAHDAQSAEKTINIKVDTGSEVTIISHRTWSALKKPRLNHAAQAIVTAAKKPLKLLGWFNAQVHWKGTSRTTKLFISPSNLQILGYPTFEALGMNAKPFKEVCCSAKTDSSKPKTEHPSRSSARTKPRSSASTTTAVAQRPAASRVAQRSTKLHSLGKGTVNVLSLDVQLKPASVSSSKKPKKTPRSISGSLSTVRKTAALSRDAAPRQPTSSGPDQSAPALKNAEDKTMGTRRTLLETPSRSDATRQASRTLGCHPPLMCMLILVFMSFFPLALGGVAC
ncbi:hypothetical protein QR680_012985 [Steinernema hermaphroditum]|uniref:Peptidase A2 domain-containing protein n=1 Tax=Steinernema hermaphroditum TaxID=289476 RepID=A0AA39I3Z8_9BILA|nr:hypothetical protein QR680_012985 [Steinernema hermaphroditum]